MQPVIPFMVGALHCAAVSAGSQRYTVRSFFANAPEDDLAAALAPYGLDPAGQIEAAFYCLLVQSDGHTVLIDTGLGPHSDSTAGQLARSLAEAGLAPEQIDTVILSHAHLDHCGGVVDGAGQPAFPQARVLIAGAEWDYWQTATESPLSLDSVRGVLDAVAPQVVRIEAGTELLPGITALAAPGHTPGQIALLIASQGDRLLYTADVIAHPLHVVHPEWAIRADVDPAQVVQTRTALLARAAAERLALYVYHLAPPGRYGVQYTTWGAYMTQ